MTPHLLLLIVVVGGIFIVMVYALGKSMKRPDPGVCRNCGYDLRGGHDRCPECGQAVPKREHKG